MIGKPVLTISLLCSGRDGTKKCLDSLNTLRKRVPSELILVDTGCGEERRRLLSSYGDEIVSFAWCDDFAKARNAGVERARGDWFLYLDDDEYFVDTEAIEEFFLSGEYKDFGYAAYTIRNFFDNELTSFQDASAVRMYSLEKNGRFQGVVHEHFEPLMEPAKILSSIAEHTGYVHANGEDMAKHSLRNIRLLEKELSKENHDDADRMRLWAHLAQEYFLLKDYEKLSAFCREILIKCAAWDEESVNRHRGCFYCGEVLAEMLQGKREAARRAYEKACRDRRNTGYSAARLMALGVELFREEEEDKAKECCRRYLKLWDDYKERPEKLFAEQTFFVVTAFYDETRNWMFSYQICLGLKRGDTSSLCRYIDFFDWDKPQVPISEELIPCIVRAMAELPHDNIFVHIADLLVNRPGMDNFWKEIGKIEEKEELGRIIGILSEMTEGTGGMAAVYLKKMLADEKEDNWKAFSDDVKRAVKRCTPLGGLLKRYAGFYAEDRMKRTKETERLKKGEGNLKVKADSLSGEKSVSEERTSSAELQKLANQVKIQIRRLYEQGMRQEAVQALEQLKCLTPADKELRKLYELMGREMS